MSKTELGSKFVRSRELGSAAELGSNYFSKDIKELGSKIELGSNFQRNLRNSGVEAEVGSGFHRDVRSWGAKQSWAVIFNGI